MAEKKDEMGKRERKKPPVASAKPAAGMVDEDGDGVPDGAAQVATAMQALSASMAKSFSLDFGKTQAGLTSGTGPKYEEATLADMRGTLLKLDATLDTLPVTLQTVRNAGYIFDNSLEREIPTLNQQWDGTMPKIMEEIQRRAQELTAASVRLGRKYPWDGTGTEPPERASAVWEFERSISSAESSVRGMYSGLEEHIRDVETRLNKAQRLMDTFAEAGFKLQPNEYPVAACEARYLTSSTDDEEGPQGFLFLTDQRLVFEQNEDIAREKVLFFTTKKEHVQEVKLDVPVGAITKVEAENVGMMGHKDFLNMRFQDPPAPRPGGRFHIQASNEEWVALINKITSGEIDADRVGAKSVAERVAAAEAAGAPAETAPDIPTHCVNCGAPISVKIVRGMTSVTCEFCGAQMRV